MFEIRYTSISTADNRARIVIEHDGQLLAFDYAAADEPDAERWLDDARHRIRCGIVPRDASPVSL